MAEKEFDVVVIGAGSTGEVAAGRIADNSDLSVAIIEQHLVGGECSFYACMPSKALLRPAEILAEIKRVPGAAEAVTGDLDVAAVLARRDEVIADLDDAGQVPWLESRGIELFRGKGRLAGERRVSVGDDVLVARKAVILAPGSGPAMPPIDGLSEVAAWSNREITVAKDVPKHLIVLGGGVVGVEMAQAWSSLGANVSIVEAQDRLLPLTGGFEPFAGEELADGLREHGVDLHLGATAVKAKRDGETVTLMLAGDKLHEGEHGIEGDHLLVATGRTPLTNDLGLETVGLEPGGWIEVDERLRVGDREWLYAPGDVNGRALLTHMGKYQGRIAGDNIMGIDAIIEADGDQSPSIVFTDPQVASVGHTLASAKAAGINATATDVPSSGNAGASFHGRNTPGTSRIVVDEDRKVMVGATFVGPETAEWLHAATIAVVGEVPMAKLWHAVPSFPSRSEVWLKLMEAYGL